MHSNWYCGRHRARGNRICGAGGASVFPGKIRAPATKHISVSGLQDKAHASPI